MKHSLRLAAVLTAAAVVLSGTALAESPGPDLLGTIFKGDTSSAEALVNKEVHTASNEDFKLTVNSSVADHGALILSVTVDALSDRAKKAMTDDFSFPSGNTSIDANYLFMDSATPTVGDELNNPRVCSGWPQDELNTEFSHTTNITAKMPLNGIPKAVRLTIGFRGDKVAPLSLDLPIAPVANVTLKIGDTGISNPSSNNLAGSQVTVNSVKVGPFSLTYSATWSSGDLPNYVPMLLLMKDGTVRTLGQSYMIGGGMHDFDTKPYTASKQIVFNSVLDLSNLTSVVLWGKEYPVDGGTPRDIEVDPSLLPFHLPAAVSIGGICDSSVPVRELMDALGGTCTWDKATRSATLEYRGITVVLTVGSSNALIDGETSKLSAAPQIIGGKLCVEHFVFQTAWFVSALECKSDGTNLAEWVVIP